MLIANPIYDSIFKALMQNERMAKYFIGTLLGCKVLEVDFRPQERAYEGEDGAQHLFRVDFVAVIRTEDGKVRKVLIEVQKARKRDDVRRFRRYLAEHYRLEGREGTYPLVCIYLLGFDLPDFPYPCVKVGRTYTDLLTGQRIIKENYFLERVTHDGYVVQVGRIPEKLGKSRLENLLAIFEQKNLADSQGRAKHVDLQRLCDEDSVAMAETLNYLAMDEEAQEQLDMEMEANEIYGSAAAMEQELARKDKELAQEREASAQKDEALLQKDEALAKEREASAEKDAALAAALAEIERLKRKN